jgi:hypothetical protein
MTCTCGAAPSQLQATCNTLFSIQENMVATTGDKVLVVNIKIFGTCSLKPSISGLLHCMPAPTAWTGFVASVQMPGGNPLLQTSAIQCATGGCISFQNSGQTKPNKVVTNPDSPQIDALKRAAKEAVPFCEDGEKKAVRKETAPFREESEKKKAVKKEILRMYWADDKGEQKTLSELPVGQEVSLFIETVGMEEGESILIELRDNDGRTYKNGEKTMKFTATVESDDTVYVDNVKIEFQ